jgi:hypothetical protein
VTRSLSHGPSTVTVARSRFRLGPDRAAAACLIPGRGRDRVIGGPAGGPGPGRRGAPTQAAIRLGRRPVRRAWRVTVTVVTTLDFAVGVDEPDRDPGPSRRLGLGPMIVRTGSHCLLDSDDKPDIAKLANWTVNSACRLLPHCGPPNSDVTVARLDLPPGVHPGPAQSGRPTGKAGMQGPDSCCYPTREVSRRAGRRPFQTCLPSQRMAGRRGRRPNPGRRPKLAAGPILL